MTDVVAFMQNYGSALVLISQLAVLAIATKFVTRTDHERAISSLDAKFVRSVEKIDKVEDRVAALENEFRHLPDRGSVHTIQLSLAELKGEMRAMGEQLKPVAAISERLQEFLLEQANRR
ncbi:Protein of unknown function [Bosea sp. CRIB-10]|uniref:DUF2730 family protein n=1 Tax=Bosea sp. CRIB-10 TaxID=378404 RepID=UPI0008E5EC77|nr:DUF2730 family protein [Bosea sp. CRIB-10]SFD78094.1 Protein of unknown function [Bosea sp. CRIB-10]